MQRKGKKYHTDACNVTGVVLVFKLHLKHFKFGFLIKPNISWTFDLKYLRKQKVPRSKSKSKPKSNDLPGIVQKQKIKI